MGVAVVSDILPLPESLSFSCSKAVSSYLKCSIQKEEGRHMRLNRQTASYVAQRAKLLKLPLEFYRRNKQRLGRRLSMLRVKAFQRCYPFVMGGLF